MATVFIMLIIIIVMARGLNFFPAHSSAYSLCQQSDLLMGILLGKFLNSKSKHRIYMDGQVLAHKILEEHK